MLYTNKIKIINSGFQIHLKLNQCSSILRFTKYGQWGFRSGSGSLNGASSVKVRRSPATVSENVTQDRSLTGLVFSHKPENPPLTFNPGTFERKGQDHDEVSIDNPSFGNRDEGFFHPRKSSNPLIDQRKEP